MIQVSITSHHRLSTSHVMTEEYLDLTEEKLERKRNGQLDFDADLIMANGAGKTKLRATDFRCENTHQPSIVID